MKFTELIFGENWRQEKKEYKLFKQKVAALPEDYRFVFNEIQKYLWNFSDASGRKTLKVLNDLYEMFAQGAADQQDVIEITGPDVGEFAENIVREIADSWMEDRKQKLNKKIANFKEEKR
ncbi:DUF1048 domain-containing protein [Enterococcus timonensis]|uniref:DUF1048 domain-containing protein n=1 Tax=Enterococcus timonensis TaxID=1852364 RepID=UPI0008DA6D9E|nr:DUF1048 domain-containing protein [Enterococcus timonensis]